MHLGGHCGRLPAGCGPPNQHAIRSNTGAPAAGSEALVSAILDAAHNQSAAQLAQVGQQFQQTAAELTAQAYNGSEEGQGRTAA